MQGLAALCHITRKGGHVGSRSTYTWRVSSPLDKPPAGGSRLVHPTHIEFVFSARLRKSPSAHLTHSRAFACIRGPRF